MLYSATYHSPVGKLLLAGNEAGLSGLWIENQKYYANTLPSNTTENNEFQLFASVINWLDRYFQGKHPPISELQLAPQGSMFRQMIWKILCEIPYGQVLTYGQIATIVARRSGRQSMSAQAVGGAVGHNPIAIIIPCHRVIGTDGNLTGYAGGLDIKIQLLRHEGFDTTRLFCPR